MAKKLDFQSVRLKALMLRAYYGVALCALTPIESPGLGTFKIDRYGRVYYDSLGSMQPQADGTWKYVEIPWKVEEAAWVLIHELNHLLRGHHGRAERYHRVAACPSCADGRRQPGCSGCLQEHRAIQAINCAQDCEINDDLRAEAAKLPAGGQYPELYGLTAGGLWEAYYPAILAAYSRPRPLCGSAAHGVPQPYEAPAPGQSGAPPGYSEPEVDLIRDATAQAILEAVKHNGRLPGGLRRWATARLSPPAVPWERELGAQTRSAVSLAYGALDYSYARPSRRGLFCGVIQPALVRPVPRIAVVLDTSGSMAEQRELPAALSEIPGIARAYGQRGVPVICCDTKPATAQLVASVSQLQLTGGGGTSMTAGILAASKLHVKVVIVLTDGYTDWPVQMPAGIELVVGLIGNTEHDQKWRPGLPHYAKRVVTIKCRDLEAA